MKRKIIYALVLITTLSTNLSFGQRFGIKGGFNLSDMMVKDDDQSFDEDITVKSTFNLGLVSEFELTDNLYLEPGLLFNMKGYNYNTEFSEDGRTFTYHEDLKVNYLEIPINLKFATDTRFAKVYGAVGPYIAFALNGKVKTVTTFDGESVKDNFPVEFGNGGVNDDMVRFDSGLNFGAGVEFGSIQIGASYGLGLSNISPFNDNGYRVKNRVFSISAVIFLID